MALLATLGSLALGACSVVGVRSTEEPRFEVVGQVGAVEIRRYAPRIAAETTIPGEEIAARSEGFRRLAGYIFGANSTKASIAMTAPVAQSSQTIAMTAPVAQDRNGAGEWVVRFFMPATFTLDTLPTPRDSRVRLVPVPADTVAVLRFSGSTGADAVAREQGRLQAALSGSGWVTDGAPFAWFYDPPWTLPPLRRNEVGVAVRR